MGYCKDCKFREAQPSPLKANKHLCTCPKLTSDSYDSKEYYKDDALIYEYDEGGGFYVGDRFGCVHWMPTVKDEALVGTLT